MSDKDRKTVRWSKDREDALKRDQGGDLSELAATDYSTFSKGAPPADYRSYVLIWDSGKCSVTWEWDGTNAALVIAHCLIPDKPTYRYEAKAYKDDRGNWVGRYSLSNLKATRWRR